MKKKNLAIYALVGAMAMTPIFTSCVDSEETSSVTAIRNAKAEQYKAIADINNAKASSAAAMAAANAALLNSQAEAQKANKAYNEAMTAWYNTQNEAEKTALEVTIKQAEADLARIQGEIDAQAIYMQAALLEAERQLMAAQKNLENATKDYDEYQKAKLQTLAQEYADAVNDLNWYQQLLTAEKARLVKLETGLMKAEEALEEKIAENNNQIALNNIQIEALKKYTNYNEDTDALYLKYLEAWNAYMLSRDKAFAANNAWSECLQKEDSEAINEAWKAINDDEFYQFVCRNRIAVVNEENEKQYYRVNNISQYFNATKNNFEGNTHEYLEEYTYTNYCGDSFSFEYEMTADIRQIELEADNNINWRKESLTSCNEAIETKQTELKTAETATATAKKAWDEAAEADKATKKAEYETALNTELGLKKDIENLQEKIENHTMWLDIYEKALDIAKNADKYNEALQAKIKAYNDANVATYAESLTAWEKAIDAEIIRNELQAEYWAIQNLYWNADNIESQIKELEANNESLLKDIENAEKLLTNYDGYDMPYEVAIELQKEWIAAKEAIVAAQEVKVNEAKTALDAAMPAEEEE